MSLIIESISAHQLCLKGPLDVSTIRQIWLLGHQLIDKAEPNAQLALDLSGVTSADSASVALLLDWLRHAKKQNKQLNCCQLPEKIQEIIRVSNLESLFDM